LGGFPRTSVRGFSLDEVTPILKGCERTALYHSQAAARE
jgi:hypothetical protein